MGGMEEVGGGGGGGLTSEDWITVINTRQDEST